MYEILMHTLRAFIGHGILKNILLAAIALIVIVLIVQSSALFRKKHVEIHKKTGYKGIGLDIINGLFKISFICVLLRLLIVALNYQSVVFNRKHGRITETNRSAILMKWGMPHEQEEIVIKHKRRRTWITRQLLLKNNDKNKKDKVYSESFWKDQPLPLKMVNGKLPLVVTEKKTLKWVDVPQKSIISSKVNIMISSNPRKLGNANYAGYEDKWDLKYIITNKSKWDTVAIVSFPLPASTGLFDNISVKVDKIDILSNVKNKDDCLVFCVQLASHKEKEVAISYTSRGLEHLRYIPARMTPTPYYRITMTLNGIPAERLDYPIGSMPPIEKLSDMQGKQQYILHWTLDNALTSYDIGVKLPKPEQPEYYYGKLLKEAPVALLLLIFILIVTSLIYRATIKLEVISLIAVVYCLHYTFMGHLAGLVTGFFWSYIISSIVSVLLIFLLRFFASDSDKYLRYTDIVSFAIMTVFFPLAVIDFKRTAFWMQLIYISIIIYVSIIILIRQFYIKNKSRH